MPPEVKITSAGRAPSRAAICSRDSSTTRRAARPEACNDEGLPAVPQWAAIASTAAGTTGVVEAWSR